MGSKSPFHINYLLGMVFAIVVLVLYKTEKIAEWLKFYWGGFETDCKEGEQSLGEGPSGRKQELNYTTGFKEGVMCSSQ